MQTQQLKPSPNPAAALGARSATPAPAALNTQPSVPSFADLLSGQAAPAPPPAPAASPSASAAAPAATPPAREPAPPSGTQAEQRAQADKLRRAPPAKPATASTPAAAPAQAGTDAPRLSGTERPNPEAPEASDAAPSDPAAPGDSGDSGDWGLTEFTGLIGLTPAPVPAAAAGTPLIAPDEAASVALNPALSGNATPAPSAKASRTATALASDAEAGSPAADEPGKSATSATSAASATSATSASLTASTATPSARMAQAAAAHARAADEARAGAPPAAASPATGSSDTSTARAQAVAAQPGAAASTAQPGDALNPASALAAGAAPGRPPSASGFDAPSTSVALRAAVHSAGFAPELAARISLLAVDGVQSAELHLNPADLGPVAVQIVVEGTQANVSFQAAQSETRTALERGLPDLAAALRDSGLTLAGGGVFQQSARQSGGNGTDSQRPSSSLEQRGSDARELDAIDLASAALSRPASRPLGLLDTFA